MLATKHTLKQNHFLSLTSHFPFTTFHRDCGTFMLFLKHPYQIKSLFNAEAQAKYTRAFQTHAASQRRSNISSSTPQLFV